MYQPDFLPEESRSRWKMVFDRIGADAVDVVHGAPQTTRSGTLHDPLAQSDVLSGPSRATGSGGESSLHKGIHEFVVHFHSERNHQGLANRLIIPDESHVGNDGAIRRRERLGSNCYYYAAA